MSSQRKIESARANGAKSNGPTSDEGRQRSSMNALKHGLYAASVLLPNEPVEHYEQMLDAYVHQFQPGGQAEFDLIEDMLTAKWRQRRLRAIETELLSEQMNGEPTQLSRAYRIHAGGVSLPFLIRQESGLGRAYFRALKSLLDLQNPRRTATSKLQERTQSQNRTPTPGPEPPVPSPESPAPSPEPLVPSPELNPPR